MKKKSERSPAAQRMAEWREKNKAYARLTWRRAYWKKLGFDNYDGVALGGMNTPVELRRKLETLREQIHNLNHQYYVQCSTTEATDAEYDRLMEELKALEAEHPELEDPNSPTKKVGAPVLAGLDKVKHNVPMLSLAKAKDVATLIKFFGGADHEGVIEPKIDGISMALYYVNGRLIKAVTRGDGVFGKEITHNARTVRSIPLMLRKYRLTVEIRGEVFMRWSAFEEHNKRLEAEGLELAANPRNAAGAVTTLQNPADCAALPLDFIAYQIISKDDIGVECQMDCLEKLEELGFYTSSLLPSPLESTEAMCQFGFALNDEDEIKRHIDILDKARRVQDFPTDGLVFKVNSLEVQKELGSSSTSPNWAIAYKFQPDQATTTLKQIEWGVGKTGKITPVGIFEPVLLSGSTVAKASLCNPQEIRRLNVNVGDEVVIEKSNEIIPKVISTAHKHSKGHAAAPVKCPVCKTPIKPLAGFVDIYCLNPTCPAQAEAKLVYATGKHGLDIDGCGPQAVALCIENGIKTLSALLGEKEFAFFKGTAAKNKMRAGVKKALSAPFWRKLSALSIDGWGRQTCQEAAAKWPTFLQIVDAFDSGQVRKVFGDNKAKNLDLFTRAYADEIEALNSLGFFPDEPEKGEGALQGKSFCLTGSCGGARREDVEEEIRKRGGIAKDGVSRKLDYLVVGDSPGNNKLTAAKQWGTKCITPDQLFDMMAWRPELPKTVDPNKEY